ncbi:hypothetical protein DACRYDRAFT_103111 [Dacryopinax primogenitus]|uniref:Uncharacterized protein n=1 Tax=Dacryopinax primogenitus (strain DJM 731) TaxID=1858805 RepID=M5G7H8_DACPD|nr:uncharacterized protein DACRYDRAFT_103111 [Dacryopinax primogenitus]EJU06166.1 hypothetical protein DACRYDRAFT_103111 [Dacryopinax primogenitus]
MKRHIGKMEHTAQYMSAEQLPMEAPSNKNLVGMGDPATSYHMGSTSCAWSLISAWELEDPNDQLCQQFSQHLKNYLLLQISGKAHDSPIEDFLTEERAELLILQN